MDRRQVMLGAAASLGPMPASGAEPAVAGAKMRKFTSGGLPITVEWFASGSSDVKGPAVLLLHGADGLAFGEGYRMAARLLASSGYHVGFVHYLNRTGDRRVVYSKLRADYPAWTGTVRDAVGWLAGQPGVDPGRLGIVGVSLGAALALEVAAADERVRAVVNYFGPLLEGFPNRAKRLPPTLILHGKMDSIVSVDHAHSWEQLMKLLGTPYELHIYPDQGHGFFGTAQIDSAARVSAFLGRHLAATTRG